MCIKIFKFLLHFNKNNRKFVKQCRYYSNNKQIRVRFAPSPTGYLHLGGLRTALYNYLFARNNNGIFILRIEDTDQTRLVEGAQKQLIEDLNWSGIVIDEGPGLKGQYGPYIQTLRLDIYRKQVNYLLNNKSAYYCFCTDRRLEILKKEALRIREVPKYDNKCRNLSESEVEKKLIQGNKYCIRFKLSSDCNEFQDMIYGKIQYDVSLNEGDPVIIKSDGYPTYHFANVVDDHLMEISHVLRGVEWQISTTKHLLLYRAFNWKPPSYGHLPLLINSDGTKLSKRQGDITILSYRNSGVLPQALINFITNSGGGFDKEINIKQKSYSMSELITMFNISKINNHSSKLMLDRVWEFNQLELERLIENENSLKVLIEELKKLVIKTYSGKHKPETLQLSDEYINSIIRWSITRITKLSDLVSQHWAFIWVTPGFEKTLADDKYVPVITNILEFLKNDSADLNKNSLNILFKDIAANNKLEFSKLMKMLRMIISGLKDGPGVAEMIEILGKNNTILRLENYLLKQRR